MIVLGKSRKQSINIQKYYENPSFFFDKNHKTCYNQGI